MSVPEDSEEELAQSLSGDPLVEFVETNKIAKPDYIPNDPQLSSQWHLSKIRALEAWDIVSSTNIIIAIGDTGINPVSDLAANMLPGTNTVYGDNQTSDVKGHGTAVAGVAAAIGDNSNLVAGIAYNAKIMPIRVTNDPAGFSTDSDLAKAIIYAADNGAKIINLSYGGLCRDQASITKSAAAYMYSKGGIVVASTGNDSTQLQYADDPDIVCVGATGSDDTKTSWSNYGTNIDVAAPGDYIYTTGSGGGMEGWWGTSFSSPMVAGLAALVWGANPSLKNSQVVDVLEKSAFDLGTPGWDESFGWGRIDAFAAVQLARTLTPQIDTTKPVTSITFPSANATISGAVSVSSSASDNEGVTKVELYKDNSLYSSDISAPYTFSFSTISESNGSHTLQTRAYDNSGNVGSSAIVNVNVNNAPAVPDTIAPVITSLTPTEGTRVKAKGKFSISTNVNDNIAVSQIDILMDGVLRKSCFAVKTCSVNVTTNSLTTGVHPILVRAYDTSKNTAERASSIIR